MKGTGTKLGKSAVQRYSVVSLFSGCGGMDLGFTGGFELFGERFKRLPFDVVWANDLNEAAVRTYKKNLHSNIKCGDVWQQLGSLPDRADVVIGGFPCQDISINGKRAGVAGARSGLYRAMLEVIKKTKPRLFIAENVKGLLMRHSAESLLQVISDFEALGYRVSYQLYNAANYGVPQTRERVFIVGTHDHSRPFLPPKATHDAAKWRSAEKAVKDLERVAEDASISHIWSRANISGEQGNRKLIADRPAQTVRAECHGNIQFHYRLPRRISMREAARFQTFPDSFMFDAKLRETERMIGNAVPPLLAWHMARAALEFLRGSPSA